MVYDDNFNRFFAARLDGRSVPIHRANFTFKAIALPAGQHVVEWSFNPYPVKIAWTLFYAGLFAYAFLLWRFLKSPTGTE